MGDLVASTTIGMILSAGYGSRLWPFTHFIPKPAMEVASLPNILWLIKMMEQAGIKDIVINTHHRNDRLAKNFLSQSTTSRLHFIHEKYLLGTAGGLRNAICKLGIARKNLLLVHGDIFCQVDLKPFIARGGFATLLLDKDRSVDGYISNVAIGKEGNIQRLGRYFSRPGDIYGQGFFTGIHFLSDEALSMIKNCQDQDLVSQVYCKWLARGFPLKGEIKNLYYEDLGTNKRLWQTNMDLLENLDLLNNNLFNGFERLGFKKNIFISSNSHIDHGVHLNGPLIISHGARIKKGATVGPRLVVGKDCTILEEAVCKNSLVVFNTTIDRGEKLNCAIAMARVRVIVNK